MWLGGESDQPNQDEQDHATVPLKRLVGTWMWVGGESDQPNQDEQDRPGQAHQALLQDPNAHKSCDTVPLTPLSFGLEILFDVNVLSTFRIDCPYSKMIKTIIGVIRYVMFIYYVIEHYVL